MLRSASLLLLLFATLGVAKAQQLSLETATGISGSHYTFFKKNTCTVQFTDTRPDPSDRGLVLCIPAAFTNTGNGHIDGIFAVSGRIGNTKAVNHSLGGVFYTAKGHYRIFQSGKGRLFNDSLLAIAKAEKASFFQQIQCIRNGKAAGFADKKLFQRRGIAILKDGSLAVVESAEDISLKVFAEDLSALGVHDLIYTDMGSWDEGWYKDPASGKLKIIGKDRSQTAYQCNWIVFRK